MKYVIIGNGYASIQAITSIREQDKKSKITVFEKGKYKAYARPLISYVIQGKAKKENIDLRGDDFYKDNNVDLFLNTTVTKIDNKKKEVVLDNGKTESFDKLIFSTGSSAFIPPFRGLDKVKYHTFITREDMEGIEKDIKQSTKALIIGSGLSGLKAAEALLKRVKSVDVVDLAPSILPSILDEKSSLMIKRRLEEEGLIFHLGTTVDEFKKKEAILTNGEILSFDLLIIAVGVRANTQLLSEIGANIERGVIVNSKCETSLEDIYAAGDVTTCTELTSASLRSIPIIPNANLQGKTAGLNASGKEAEFKNPIAMNAIGFFGLYTITAGSYEGGETVIETETGYKKFFVKDNKLKGFILIGDTVEKAGIYTSLIREEKDLREVNTDMIFSHPTLIAFAKEDRVKKLGERQ